MARQPLTTPRSETVTQFDLTRFDARLDTSTFVVTVTLTSDDETIVRAADIGGTFAELSLLPATVADLRAKLRAFLQATGRID